MFELPIGLGLLIFAVLSYIGIVVWCRLMKNYQRSAHKRMISRLKKGDKVEFTPYKEIGTGTEVGRVKKIRPGIDQCDIEIMLHSKLESVHFSDIIRIIK